MKKILSQRRVDATLALGLEFRLTREEDRFMTGVDRDAEALNERRLETGGA